MILLIIFSLLAGTVTILSPCILPILPIVLATGVSSKNSSMMRPLGVITGFVLSFTFFTLFLSTIVRASGIPANTLRLFSIFVIATFGFTLLVPRFQEITEKLFSKLTQFTPNNQNKSGFWGGILVGLSIGLLWTPCVGPILASVISLAITGVVTLDAFTIVLSYSIGTAIPMFLIMYGGRNMLQRIPWIYSKLILVQKIFGGIMILVALSMFFNIDRKFQTFVLSTFPNYGTGLTKFEDSTLIRELINKKSAVTDKVNFSNKKLPIYSLLDPPGVTAPEIIPGGVWFNSDPLTLAGLKGKVVLLDFWTYSCINCQRTLPYLRDWYQKYKDKGLVVIGVHSPEFEFEKNQKNVAQAIADFKLNYPVVQDNDFATWRAYSNQYWPAKYFIDKNGYIRHAHFGEGEYDKSEQVIQELLKDIGVTDLSSEINNPTYQVNANTRETYLGTSRNPLKIGFTPSGGWSFMDEYARPQKGATLKLNFDAKEVFLVMRAGDTPAKVRVYVDDKLQYYGLDNINGTVTVSKDALYKLINLPVPGKHTLRLEFEDGNAELYAFTFG